MVRIVKKVSQKVRKEDVVRKKSYKIELKVINLIKQISFYQNFLESSTSVCFWERGVIERHVAFTKCI